MSTAAEMLMRQAEAQRWLDYASRRLNDEFVQPLTIITFGREVCARRARKLRKRGDAVRFKRWTPNGRCRYAWMRQPIKLVLTGA